MESLRRGPAGPTAIPVTCCLASSSFRKSRDNRMENLCAEENESHRGFSKRKKRSRESRLRPLQGKWRAKRNRSEFHFRDARRRRHLFQSRGSRQVGRRPAQSHFVERKRIPARVSAGKTKRWLRAPLAQGSQRR